MESRLSSLSKLPTPPALMCDSQLYLTRGATLSKITRGPTATLLFIALFSILLAWGIFWSSLLPASLSCLVSETKEFQLETLLVCFSIRNFVSLLQLLLAWPNLHWEYSVHQLLFVILHTRPPSILWWAPYSFIWTTIFRLCTNIYSSGMRDTCYLKSCSHLLINLHLKVCFSFAYSLSQLITTNL